MELLARFELATSSLPILFRLFFLDVAYRILFLKHVATQYLFHSAYRFLMYVVVPCWYGFLVVGMGFVWVFLSGKELVCYQLGPFVNAPATVAGLFLIEF